MSNVYRLVSLFNQLVLFYSLISPTVAKILKTPKILVRFLLALISVSQATVDHIICRLVDKLIRFGLYEPRLTSLLSSLESKAFLRFFFTYE